MPDPGHIIYRAANEVDLAQVQAIQARRVSPFPTPDALVRWAASQDLLVAIDRNAVIGWTVLEHSFFEEGFIPTLWVAETHRRRGIATALIGNARGACRTDRIWTSTNLSNHPMQCLLKKLEWKLSGVLHYLDPDDPELVFVHLGPGKSEGRPA